MGCILLPDSCFLWVGTCFRGHITARSRRSGAVSGGLMFGHLIYQYVSRLPIKIEQSVYNGDIRKLSHSAIMWRCLRDPAFSRFSRMPTCDGRTDGQTDNDDSTYRTSIASRGMKKNSCCVLPLRFTDYMTVYSLGVRIKDKCGLPRVDFNSAHIHPRMYVQWIDGIRVYHSD